MKLSEYLPLRGIKANALTKREARDIGITLDKGWAKRHANVEVPAHLVEVVRTVSPSGRKLSGAAKPVINKKIGKIKQKHLIAATKYLQDRGRLLELGDIPGSFVTVAAELFEQHRDSVGFLEKYGQGDDGMRRMVHDFFDDVDVSQLDYLKAARAKENERKSYRKSNTQVAKEIKKFRTKTTKSKSRSLVSSMTVGGVNVATDAFLATYEWRNLRIKALNLYGRRCMCCGDTPENGAIMNVDHIKPRRHYPELALDIRALQILCGPCNHGKGNELETDYRTPAQIAAAVALAKTL